MLFFEAFLKGSEHFTEWMGSCCGCFTEYFLDLLLCCIIKCSLSYLDHVPVNGCSAQASFLVDPLSDFRLRLLLHFLLLLASRLGHLVIPPLFRLLPHCIGLIRVNQKTFFYLICLRRTSVTDSFIQLSVINVRASP